MPKQATYPSTLIGPSGTVVLAVQSATGLRKSWHDSTYSAQDHIPPEAFSAAASGRCLTRGPASRTPPGIVTSWQSGDKGSRAKCGSISVWKGELCGHRKTAFTHLIERLGNTAEITMPITCTFCDTPSQGAGAGPRHGDREAACLLLTSRVQALILPFADAVAEPNPMNRDHLVTPEGGKHWWEFSELLKAPWFLPVSGAVLYAILLRSYSRFYDRLGLTP